MSATPPTPRGRETERLMLLWRKQNPDADSSAYNREWDSVYRKLEGTFSDDEAPQRGFLDDLEDGQPRYILKDDGFHPVPADIVATVKQRPRDPRHKHAAQTKGAFGKPKHLRRR